MKMNDLLSTAQVAKALGVSRIAILQRIQNKKIKAEKVGRNYIIRKEEVLRLLGEVIGEENKKDIDKAIAKALGEYGKTFKKLGKE
jgi:excisionase family DNA binding protein